MTWEMMCPFSLPISLFSSSTVVPMVEPGKITITKTHIEYLEHKITKAQKAEVSEAYNPPSIWVTKVPSLSDNSDGLVGKISLIFSTFTRRGQPDYNWGWREEFSGVTPFTMHRMRD